MPRRPTAPSPPDSRPSHGLGQLTLVEHALCPLGTGHAGGDGAVYKTGYYYVDKNRRYKKAAVQVTTPGGLLPGDELYLWGLLALTLAEPEPDGELHATPHHCLRRLGLIDQHANRGGRQYQQFAAALDRLAQVSYASDAFYDPVRGEHRRVRFGFLSYSLPLAPGSCRAWRVAWDPVFFDLVRPLGGHLRFDLECYRTLDPAARRLFLLLSKIFCRRSHTPRFGVAHLAVDVLGFSPTLAPRHQRQKLARVVGTLAEAGVVAGPAAFEPGPGRTVSVVLARGPRFSQPARPAGRADADSPLWEGLLELGLDPASARRLLASAPRRVVREWLDITLAARERFGPGFFRKSPQAYLVHNVGAAVASGRTAPDWWHDLRKRERDRPRPVAGENSGSPRAGPLVDHSAAVLRRVTEAVFPAGGSSGDRPQQRASLLRPIR
jgi:hypothetical protein